MSSSAAPARRPRRLQRKRLRGSSTPAGAVYVGRPSKYGNPYSTRLENGDWCVFRGGLRLGRVRGKGVDSRRAAAAKAVQLFEEAIELGTFGLDRAQIRAELAGRDVVCWCKASDPCHGDVLLRIASEEVGDDA